MGISYKNFQGQSKIKGIKSLPPEAIVEKRGGVLDDYVRGVAADVNPNIVAGDPHWANVVLLADFESGFDDLSGRHTVTTDGTPTRTTGKIGSGLVQVDGTNVFYNDNLDDFYLDGDFTVEFWIKFSTDVTNQQVQFMSNTTNPFVVGDQQMYKTSAGFAFHNRHPNNDLFIISQTTGDQNYLPDTWYYYTLVRSGNDWYIFKDGQIVHQSTASPTLYNTGNPLGTNISHNSTQTHDGMIDQIRITKGVARYTENFTPPTEPFPTGA